MKKVVVLLMLLIVSQILLWALAPIGSGTLWVYDAAAQTVRTSVHTWSLANYAGAAALRFVWGYSAAEVNDASRQMSCVLPCAAVMDTTVTVYFKIQPLNSSGVVLVDPAPTVF